MRKNILTIALILILPLIAFFVLSTGKTNENLAQAANSGKPQIIKFTSLMCVDCQKLNEVIKEVYPNYKDNIDLIEVSVDGRGRSTSKLIEKYGVTLVPTMIFIDANNNQIRKIEDFIEKTQLEQYMKEIINNG